MDKQRKHFWIQKALKNLIEQKEEQIDDVKGCPLPGFFKKKIITRLELNISELKQVKQENHLEATHRLN